MKFYLEESLRIQGISQLDKNLVKANKLLEWIKEKDLTSFPLHHITQKGPNSIRDTARARRLLNILVQHGRITEPKAGEWDGRLCKEMYIFLE
jgi:hypothetical protein